MQEENTCDKCGYTRYTENLVWFSEDFEPFIGEIVNWEEVKKQDYQAVCDGCYETLLII